MNFDQYASVMRPAVEDELHRVVDEVKQIQPELYVMLAYHLGWQGEGAGVEAQGKRIRPILVLLAADAAGGDWHTALPAAAAVELIHNFSLIHDDIQDQSPLRRGRPTLWVKWGTAQAINAGDVMFTLAHLAMYRLGRVLSASVVLDGAQLLDRACIDLTEGQFLDLSYEKRRDLAEPDYWPMVRGKTAALLGCSAELGALVAGSDAGRRADFRQFGLSLGLAFQALDDWLGIWGDAALIGKSTESDLVSGKKTLPVLYGLERGGLFETRWSAGQVSPEEVPALAGWLEEKGARDHTEREADRLTGDALAALERATGGQPEKANALRELAMNLLKRRK